MTNLQKTGVEAWLNRHSHIILPILIIVLMVLIFGLMVAILNMSHISTTESGTVYNQMGRII